MALSTAPPRAARRLTNLDVLRALAALLVVAGHSYALGGRYEPVIPDKWSDIAIHQCASGVWLFFVLSGYLIGRPFVDALVRGDALPSLGRYAVKRAARIYPLYWLALTAVIVTVGASGTKAWQYPVHYLLLQNLVPGRQAALLGVAWTLTLEVLFYAAIAIAAYAVRRVVDGPVAPARLARWICMTWLASIAWGAACALLVPDTTFGVWLRELLPGMWGEFCPGLLIAVSAYLAADGRWRRWLVDVPGRASSGAVLAVVALTTAVVCDGVIPFSAGVRTYVLANTMSAQIFALGYGVVVIHAIRARPWDERAGRWLLDLGLISYGIYLLHATIGLALLTPAGSRFIPMPHGGFVAGVVHFVFLAALTVPLAWLSWHLLEQPLIGWSHRVGRRRVAPSLATAGAPAD